MIVLSSPAFSSGDVIPTRYTQEGENISPPLQWDSAGVDAQEYALICEDPDASDEPFAHWLIWGIEAGSTNLPEGVKPIDEMQKPLHVRQGVNSAGKIGYIGPMPPITDTWHYYWFKLFALNEKIDLAAGSDRYDFYAAITRHIVDKAELVGRYHRLKRLQEPTREVRP